MHLSDEIYNYESFINLILNGEELSELDKKLLKHNKTFDDWCEIKLDKNYKYASLYSDRKAVINNLLFTIGTGYGYENGYIIEQASGADVDKSLYSDFKNSKLDEKRFAKVLEILNDESVKLAVNCKYELDKKYQDERIADEIKAFGMTYKEFLKSDRFKKYSKDSNTWKDYYPLSHYSNISKFDEHTYFLY